MAEKKSKKPLQVTFYEISKQFYSEQTQLARYQINYPSLEGDGTGLRAINRAFKERAKRQAKWAEQEVLMPAKRHFMHSKATFVPLSMSTDWQMMYIGAQFISGFCDTYLQLQSEGEKLYRFSSTIDLASGARLPLGAFFRRNTAWEQTIHTCTTVQIEQGSEYFEFYQRCTVEMPLAKSHNYYLSPDGISIWYPQGKISPHRQGIPTLFVPFEKLKSMLRFAL